MPDTKILEAHNPIDLGDLTVTEAKTHAAGMTAVAKSMAHTLGLGGISGTKTLALLNQIGGVDCTSCAWPEPDEHRSSAEFCENGAKAIAWETDTRRITRAFWTKYTIQELGTQTDYEHGQHGRLTEPMIRRAGSNHYEPITWDQAFALIARELNALASPNEAAFYTSGRASNEAAFLYQLFVRQFGTNNFPDCSNMCHESSSVALPATIGIGKGTVKLDDFEKSELILILGQNPGTNHPRMLTALQKAKRAGATIVAINPLKEAGLLAFANPQEVRGMMGFATPLADHFLQVKIGGDQALLQGVLKHLLHLESLKPGHVVDAEFVNSRTDGFEAMKAQVQGADWALLTEQSGITRAEMEKLAELMASKSRIIACWAMGLTQQKHAVATIQELVNVLLVRGSVGKPGAGFCPVRGHSNVQGDRTVGINEHAPAWFLDSIEKVFGFSVPREHGLNTVDTIRAMHEGRVKVFFALGGNFLSATPDTDYTAEALQKTRLTVQVSIKLNRSHLVTGQTALILPCLGRTERDMQASGEQFVTTENSMGVVQRSQGQLAPASPELKSEVAIVAGVAQATLGDKSQIPWAKLTENYDGIRDLIEKVIPGFENYNTRVRLPGGFYLPNKPRDGDFPTATGKARFTANTLPTLKLEAGQFVMMTVRTHDQFNTTVYGLEDRYRGIHKARRVILMNPTDMREAGLTAGDCVDLTSHFQGETRVAPKFLVVEYDIPRRCTATYFPETNVLVPINSTADKSHTPTSKYVVITVKPSA
ncbi:MAG: FdhF/YdeP family oxidoreductase [Fimbriiglobus sp.]